MDLEIHSPIEEKRDSLIIYIGGVADTLDGSSGFTFTYLPIVYEDDSQICESSTSWVQASEASYVVRITLLRSATEA